MQNHVNLIILATSALLTLVACGGSGSSSSPASSASSVSSSSPVSSDVTSSSSSSSQEQSGKYSLSVHYSDDTKENIPADAVNRVMFVYGDSVDATFKTELTLDAEKGTYELYKQIYGAGEDPETPNCNAEYYFYGSYEREGDVVTLTVPTSGKASIFYPTILNYQSIEKQTQGFVDMNDEPVYKTRFNDWYPAKMSDITAQKVTLKGSSMEFEGHEIKQDTPAEESSEPTEKTPKISAEGTQGGTLAFYEDFTYSWSKTAGGKELKEEGSWALDENHLITLTFQENVTKGVLAEDNSQSIEYTPYSLGGYAEQLKETFTFSVGQWGQLTLIKPAAQAVISGEGTQGGVLTFNDDFSYSWVKTAGGKELKEEGTWVLDDNHLITLAFEENVTKGAIAEDNSQSIEYTPYSLGGYAEQLKETFTFSVGQWGQLTLVK